MKTKNSYLLYLKGFLLFQILVLVAQPAMSQSKKKPGIHLNTVTNFDKDGRQITRFSTVGDAIDAHDGEIALFNGIYYLYGTSYDCGFEWGNKSAPFCGFKSYSSTDMVNWTDRGLLFDAHTSVWQTRCNGNTYGCFRPHVIYNSKTGLYVLWINVYDNVSGYRVFTAKSPVGPFTEVAEPKLAVNANAPAAGLNNGDHDTFVDDDGTAYLAYTDWRTKGTIVVEKLSDDYLTGTSEVATGITKGDTEAPGMFKRNGIYYIVYSDPNCGYCAGTGASYSTATSPLGPWSAGKKISDNSCGGQPSFVSTIKLGSGTVFLFGSDLWNNAAKNEALANYYWAPLIFNADGSIIPMTCEQTFKVSTLKNRLGNNASAVNYKTVCDISQRVQRSQAFPVPHAGVLTKINLTAFKTGYPNAGLTINIYKANSAGQPTGQSLGNKTVLAGNIGWSAKKIAVPLNIASIQSGTYCAVISSAATIGCYGLAYRDGKKTSGTESYSNNGGKKFTVESTRELKFSSVVTIPGIGYSK